MIDLSYQDLSSKSVEECLSTEIDPERVVKLDLSYCSISSSQESFLAGILPQLPNLRNINLEGNDLTNSLKNQGPLLQLLKGLWTLKDLQYLNLQRTNLSEEIAKEIIRFLSSSSTKVLFIDVFENPDVSFHSQEKISKMLQKNVENFQTLKESERLKAIELQEEHLIIEKAKKKDLEEKVFLQSVTDKSKRCRHEREEKLKADLEKEAARLAMLRQEAYEKQTVFIEKEEAAKKKKKKKK